MVSLKKKDKLIILGDIIDRGPDSKGVIDTIFLLLENGFDVRCLKGNHEQLLIDSFDNILSKVNWVKNGGNSTLKSFLTSDVKNIPEIYIDYLKSMNYYLIEGDHIFVHAGIDMTKTEPLKDKESMLWLRDWEEVYDNTWLKERVLIHGHTPETRDEIKNRLENDENKVLGIDNGIYLKEDLGYSNLCVLEVETKKVYFQTNID